MPTRSTAACPGPARLRDRRRPRPHPCQRALGDGRAGAGDHRRAGSTKGLMNGITCGAGMPYRLSEIAARFNVHYYPIVSSARAFRRCGSAPTHKVRDLLGGVVYEDPWLAGGHNGLSNSENPARPEDPFPARAGAAQDHARVRPGRYADHHGRRRLVAEEWEDWIDNPGSRPGRVPVRHAAAADEGKPDPGEPGRQAADAEAGRRVPQPLQPDRVLFLGRQQRFHPGTARPQRAAGGLQHRAGRASTCAEFGVGARKRSVYLTAPDLPA